MTLILGINLTDRLYLAADTRVSRQRGDIFEKVHDNQLKVIRLNDHTIIGCAGKVQFVKHLTKHLVASELRNMGINQIRRNIEKIINQAIDNYLSSGKTYDESRACLMFAGLDEGCRKRISLKTLNSRRISFDTYLQKEFASIIESIDDGDDIDPNRLNKVNKLRLGDLCYQPVYKPIIKQALKKNSIDEEGRIKIDTHDGLIFKIKIAAPNPPEYFDINWGEYAICGSLVDLKEIPEKVIGELEFAPHSGEKTRDVCAIVHWITERFKDTIGGAVTVFEMSEGKIKFLPHDITRGVIGNSFKKEEKLPKIDLIDGKFKVWWNQKDTPDELKHLFDAEGGNCII
jgi:hypothetical protein